MVRVTGSDVSFYQDDPNTPMNINFDVMMLAGAVFSIIRAGQWTWVDRDFKKNWKNAKAAGMPRGSYWFYDSRGEPKKQAQLWVSTLGSDLGELPLFADFEDSYGGTWGRWGDWYTFLEEVKRLAPGKEIGIYTAFYYWDLHTIKKGIPKASLDYFVQYPLWIANYGVSSPLVPLPWSASGWTFWQFTDKGDGRLYGAESLNIDLNYFNGDLAEFNARFGLNGSDPNPNPPEEEEHEMTIIATLKSNNTTRRAVRTSAKVEGNPIGYANPASVVMNATQKKVLTADGEGGVGSLKGDEWYFVENVDVQFFNTTNNYGKASGWVAAKHKGEVLCIVTPVSGEELPPPAPDPTPGVAVTVDTLLKVVTVNSEAEMEVYFNGDKLR
jgi:lysozyme